MRDHFQLTTLFDQLAIGLVAVDGHGVVRAVNSAAERMLGRPREHLLNVSLATILPGHTVAVDLAHRAQNLSMPCRCRNTQISPAPGRLLTISVTAVPLFGDQGQAVGAVLEMEEQGAAERIEEGERLHETLDSLSSLAMVIAHEVKNPMAGIRGAAQLLEMEPISAAGRTCTEIIRSEVDRVTRMLDSLLGLADTHNQTDEEINIHEILDHAMMLCQGRTASIHRDYDPSLPSVRGCRDRLIQLFLNLVQNGCEAAGVAGKVTLCTRISQQVRLEQGRRNLHVVAEVRDNGPGIPEEMRKRIFLPFVTTKSKGTGLGLAIAQKIVHEHGGLIEADSFSGDTIFRVFLPVIR